MWYDRGDSESDDAFGGNGVSTIFRDVLLNMAAAFCLLALVFLMLANPPGQEEETRKITPPGNILVELYWSDTVNADVDLWVRGPEGNPVGFSNLVGTHYNLLRDDLGIRKDDPVNYESTFSRGIPVGEHCVNTHLYGNVSGTLPLEVTLTVKISKGKPGADSGAKGSSSSPILTSRVTFEKIGQEINVFCFKLDESGDLITDSVYRSPSVILFGPRGALPSGGAGNGGP